MSSEDPYREPEELYWSLEEASEEASEPLTLLGRRGA